MMRQRLAASQPSRFVGKRCQQPADLLFASCLTGSAKTLKIPYFWQIYHYFEFFI
jgi:hypothetical protein